MPFNVRADDAYTQGTDTLSVGIGSTSGGNFEALTTTSTASTTVTDDADRHGGHPDRLGGLRHRRRQHRLHRHASTTRSPAAPLVITLTNGQTITIPVGQSSADSVPFNVRADDAYTQGTDTLSVGISNTSGGNFEALTTTLHRQHHRHRRRRRPPWSP